MMPRTTAPEVVARGRTTDPPNLNCRMLTALFEPTKEGAGCYHSHHPANLSKITCAAATRQMRAIPVSSSGFATLPAAIDSDPSVLRLLGVPASFAASMKRDRHLRFFRVPFSRANFQTSTSRQAPESRSVATQAGCLSTNVTRVVFPPQDSGTTMNCASKVDFCVEVFRQDAYSIGQSLPRAS